jgi:ribosomal-protein-alanine N-acetyltransferase
MPLQTLGLDEVTGQRIALFQVQPGKLTPEYREWLRSRQIYKYLEARVEEHTSATLAHFVTHCNASPSTPLLGMRRLDEGRYIGNIKLSWDVNHTVGDIGTMLGDVPSWDDSFATEAIALTTRVGFASLGLRKIVAGIYEGNTASLHAFNRCGCRIEATLKEHALLDGVAADVFMMRLLQQEYAQRPPLDIEPLAADL